MKERLHSLRRTVLVAWLGACATVAWPAARQQTVSAPTATVAYTLAYAAAGDSRVHVSLSFPAPLQAPRSLVMPRNYPGGYSIVPYDSFVEHVQALPVSGAALTVSRDADGPRWTMGKAGEAIARIEYDVDIARMEHDILSAVETSKMRPRYLGLLGYSVFAFVDGLEEAAIDLRVTVPSGWPVLTTLASSMPAPVGAIAAHAPNYYALADAQMLAGPDLQVRRFDGTIPLFVAAYVEGEEDLGIDGQLARTALDRVQAYFGDHAIARYTVHLELLRPLPGHDYGFSQEHLDSGSFSLDTTRAITAQSTPAERTTNLMNYAHHIAHSWIPKRAYGVGYMPFNWELPPIIDTIWFNEGFGRYAAVEALAAGMPAAEGTAFRTSQLDRLGQIVAGAPPFIKAMPLATLSREASFMYSTDFRTGKNVFSRGALMAADMDERIRDQTGGTRSLRDALRFLVAWTDQHHRAFQVDELPGLIQQATGVDVRDILEHWSR